MIDKNFTTLIDYTLIHGGDTSGIRFFVQNPESGLKITGEDNRRVFPTMRKNTFFICVLRKNIGLGRFIAREILADSEPSKRETGEEGKVHGLRSSSLQDGMQEDNSSRICPSIHEIL